MNENTTSKGRKATAALLGGAVLLLAGACALPEAETTGAPAAAAEQVLTQETTDAIVQGAMMAQWRTYSAQDQADACWVFTEVPDLAWEAFNEGADGSLTWAEFHEFFTGVC